MRRFTVILLLVVSIFLVAGSLPGDEPSLRIRLRWVPSYEKESWSDVRTGLAWSLSYLGAALPRGSMDSAITRLDSTVFEIDLDRVGFSSDACSALSVILDSLKASDEYHTAKAIDLGRFLVLTVHSSWHYYAITGVKKSLAEFLAAGKLEKALLEYPMMNSGVAIHHRIVRFNPAADIKQMAFVAEESDGSLDDGTFQPRAYEAFDIMKNGQPRYAIYDEQGNLTAASPTAYGIAGKPSKCMWCHESSVLPLYVEPHDLPGAMSGKTFIEYATGFQKKLNAYRKTLDMDVDYSRTQDHTLSELLYIGFMEPSWFRTTREWQRSDSTLVADLPKHVYDEFPDLGKLFYRQAVDSLAPYTPLQVPFSVREPGNYEPDYLGLSSGRNR